MGPGGVRSAAPLEQAMDRPDLSAADAWLVRRSPQDRKRFGQWPTPFELCVAAIERLASRCPAAGRIVDPACGDARWLVAAARRFPGAELWGIDADPTAIDAARRTLQRAGVAARLICADALLDDVVPECDAIVGNPPYVRPQHLPRPYAKDVWRRFRTMTDKCDLSVGFVELACDRAEHAALVVGRSLLSLGSFAALRERVLEVGLDGVFGLPDRTFDAAIRTVLLEIGPPGRRTAGHYAPGSPSFEVRGTVGVATDAWSLDGPLRELPGTPLGTYVRFHMGVVCGDYARYVHRGPRGPLDEPTCRGRDVRRFDIAWTGDWLRYDPADMLARKPYVAPKHRGVFEVPEKVVIAGTTGQTIVAALDTARRFPLDSCYVALPRRDDVDPAAVLGFLLCPAVADWYGARFEAPRVKGIELARIPVPPPERWHRIGQAVRDRDEAALARLTDHAYTAIMASTPEGPPRRGGTRHTSR